MKVRVENRIANTPLGVTYGHYVRRQTKFGCDLFMKSYQLVQAQTYYESQPKSKYHFWKKDVTTPDIIFKRTIERMEHFASKRNQTD